MNHFKFFCAALAACGSFAAYSAEFASYFSDNMVLQRDVQCPIWGIGTPGEKVELQISSLISGENGISVSSMPPYLTTVDSDGKWQINVNPTAVGGPYLLMLKSDDKSSKLENVMFGDVYLCSGQSNMEFRLAIAEEGKELIANANIPNLRLLQVKNNWSALPLNEFEGKWTISNSADAANFSAVAFIAGKKLVEELNIPIGLVQADWGGTPIESWISRDAMAADDALFGYQNSQMKYYDKSTPEYKNKLNELSEEFAAYSKQLSKCAGEGVVPPKSPLVPAELYKPNNMAQPAVHFNAMINPLIPAAFKGVFWYQGCSNVGWTTVYDKYLEAWAADWRARFNAPSLPLIIVQISPYDYEREYKQLPQNEHFEKLVYGQQQFTDRDENSYLVVTNDVGNINDIHPVKKIPVGSRIADLCLEHIYNRDIQSDSPLFDKVFPGSNGELIVHFRNAENGLSTSNGKAPDWFEVSAADGIFLPASARIEDDCVILSNPEVLHPVAARFAWSDKAEPNLRNAAGLPAACFKSDIPDSGDLLQFVPSAVNFETIYKYIPSKLTQNEYFNRKYEVNNAAKFAGRKIKRIGYFVEGIMPDFTKTYVFVTMDPFTEDVAKIGVPFNYIFQQKLSNIEVFSNVPGVATGKFPEGAIEFWPNSFDPKKSKNWKHSSGDLYDWDDTYQPDITIGYGSMQIHNISSDYAHVIFAYNNFKKGAECEFGIGSNASGVGHPDYVYADSGKFYKQISIIALAEFE